MIIEKNSFFEGKKDKNKVETLVETSPIKSQTDFISELNEPPSVANENIFIEPELDQKNNALLLKQCHKKNIF